MRILYCVYGPFILIYLAGQRIGLIILGIALWILTTILIIPSMFFKIIINGTNIKVRESISKKYEFDATEIEKITCYSTSSSQRGLRNYIGIFAKSKEIEIDMCMSGAGKLVEYLLELYETNTLNLGTINHRHKRTLTVYKDRYTKKKKKEISIKKRAIEKQGVEYKTIVKTRKNTKLKDIMPLGIWLIACFATLFMLRTTEFAVLLMGIVFLSIIPITYFMTKKLAKEYKGENGWENKEITFNVINGNLYIDNKIMNVTQNKSQTEIYIEDIIDGTAPLMYTFMGTIEEPYVNDFIKFLKEQSVGIDEQTRT